MKNKFYEIKLTRAEESVRICKLNIENQVNKLKKTNEKIAAIKSIIASNNSIPADELKKLINTNDRLIIDVENYKIIILELQGDLNINKNNLHQLKPNSIQI